MTKSKVYAVRKGRIPGIYKTWDECSKQVSGFSGAEYKSFSSLSDAKEYYYANEKISHSTTYTDVYVDGSFDKNSNRYSCGVVILLENEIVKLKDVGSNVDLASMNNVAGELMGAMLAMEYAFKNSIPAINIHYDYEGIRSWAVGDWKANKIGTKDYVEFFNLAKEKVKVEFTKVKAHSGNKYNDLADSLAGEAFMSSNIDEKAVEMDNAINNSDIEENRAKLNEFKEVVSKYNDDNSMYLELIDISICMSDRNVKNISKYYWKKNKRLIKNMCKWKLVFNSDRQEVLIDILGKDDDHIVIVIDLEA